MISQKPKFVWITASKYYIPDLVDVCVKTFRVNLTEIDAVEAILSGSNDKDFLDEPK